LYQTAGLPQALVKAEGQWQLKIETPLFCVPQIPFINKLIQMTQNLFEEPLAFTGWKGPAAASRYRLDARLRQKIANVTCRF
jgi:hypothetical protein